MLKSFALKTKLILSFSVTSIFLLTVGAVGVFSGKNTTAEYDQVTELAYPKMLNLVEMKGGLDKLLSLLIQMGLAGNSEKEIMRIQKRMTEVRGLYDQNAKTYLQMPRLPQEKELYEKMSEQVKLIDQHILESLPLAVSELQEDKLKFTAYYAGDFKSTRHELYKRIDALIDFQKSLASTQVLNVKQYAALNSKMMITISLLGTLFAFLVGIIISKKLTDQLSSLAQELTAGAKVVSSEAQELSQAGKSLSTSVVEQSSSLQETSAAVQELTSMVERNLDTTLKSQQTCSQGHQMVSKGNDSVQRVVAAIEDIASNYKEIVETIEKSNTNIMEITKVISEIGTKTKVINDIVFQTKLLSFNASVEAARAGEHGKGFAVVAEEIGSLAQMSGNAAREISQMLSEGTLKTQGLASETKSQADAIVRVSANKIEVGMKMANESGEILKEIVVLVEQIKQMTEQVSTASGEQKVGIEEISKAILQLTDAMENNSQTSRKTSHSSTQLSSESLNLQAMIQRLLATLNGEKGAPIPHLRPSAQIRNASSSPQDEEETEYRKAS